jgi:hypothetical protein
LPNDPQQAGSTRTQFAEKFGLPPLARAAESTRAAPKDEPAGPPEDAGPKASDGGSPALAKSASAAAAPAPHRYRPIPVAFIVFLLALASQPPPYSSCRLTDGSSWHSAEYLGSARTSAAIRGYKRPAREGSIAIPPNHPN